MALSKQYTGLFQTNEQKMAARVERKEQLLRLVDGLATPSRKELIDVMEISKGSLRIYMMELFEEGRLSQEKWDHYRGQGRLVQRNHAQRVRHSRKGYLELLIHCFPRISLKEIMNDLGILQTDTIVIYMNELEEEGHLPEGAREAFNVRLKEHVKRARNARQRRIKFLKNMTPEERHVELLVLMANHPTASIEVLAKQLYVSKRTVERDRSTLRKTGYLTGHGEKLRIVHEAPGARRELKKRLIVQVLLSNPSINVWNLARKIEISATVLGRHVNELYEDGRLTGEQSIRFLTGRQEMIAKRFERQPRLLNCIAGDMTIKEISRTIGVTRRTVNKDIEAMRELNDPGLLMAEKQRDKFIASRPVSKGEKAMKEALGEMGLTLEDLAQQHTDWLENAGPDDPLIRRAVVATDAPN